MQDTPTFNRRQFCGAAASTLAAGTLGFPVFFSEGSKAMNAQLKAGDATALRPFHVNIPEADLTDLRKRISATKFPERETVADASQGVQLATVEKLARYWATEYDWRKCEARINAVPNFITEIDGLDIHFIHVRSKHENALPIIITHGWPGSVVEQMKIIEPLTNPTAHGGSATDAFDVVIPSLPGHGFSGKPTTTGWDPQHVARAWIVLMKRLGYERFASQGGDLGGIVTNIMAKQAPPELIGIHVNFPASVPAEILKSLAAGDAMPAGLSDEEKHAYEQLSANFKKKRGYAFEMGTRPQTLYGLADSPVALASWLLDHGDGYGQPAAALSAAVLGHPVNGHSAGALTRDDILDDITLYWLTNTGISAARFYWESHANFFLAADVNVPAAVSAFPGENYQAPKTWTEKAYHNLIYFNKPETGGHFAAWEEPMIFANEVRAGLRPLRA